MSAHSAHSAHSGPATSRITVVGIGAEGWAGLSEPARQALREADEVIGSVRQLASLPPSADRPRRAWPSPLAPLLEELLARTEGHTCVLASGDPMHFGIGASILARLGPAAMDSGRVRIISHSSAAALALARLGWSSDGVELLSTLGRPLAAVLARLQPGRRLVVYVPGPRGGSDLAAAITAAGFGASDLHVLEQLGGPAERVRHSTAAAWVGQEHDALTTIAVRVVPDPGLRFLSTAPGLPDGAYDNDGQLTKRHVRAATLAALAPAPRQLLWDIGAGSGSIAIEWLRAEPTARAVAIERHPERAARIAANARTLGVPALSVLSAAVPEALGEPGGPPELREPPDAIFVGGGLSGGVLAQAWARLLPGGRLVVNAVTIEAEQILVDCAPRYGADLVKLAISHAEPLGGFTAWRPALPIVQWSATKPGPRS